MVRKPDIWMPLYIGDWDAKTKHLTCEQDGAYGRLVRFYWKNGAPPDDNSQLRQIVGLDAAAWRKARPVLARFFNIREGRWFHDRVEEELGHARDVIEKRRAAGLQGGRPKKQTESKQKPNGLANEKQTETPARVEVDSKWINPSPIQEEGIQDTGVGDNSLGDGVVKFPGRGA